jgi:cellulose synthase operon protein C
MRTLNVRLAVICVVVIVLLSGGIVSLHAFQVLRRAEALNDASKRAEADKNLDEAIRHLQSYVFLRPNDREAQYRLGMLLADRRSYGSAFDRLEEVMRNADGSLSADDLRKARRKLVDVALKLGRAPDAEVHLKVLMDETPNDPELMELDGEVLFYNEKYKEACDQFRTAIAKSPTLLRSYLLLATILRQRFNSWEEADKVMRDMVSHKGQDGKEINGGTLLAHQHYADYLCMYLNEPGKVDAAMEEAKRILELAPEDPWGLWFAGRSCLAKGQYETAEGYLKRGIAAKKDDWDRDLEWKKDLKRNMYDSLAIAKKFGGHRPEAIEVLKQGLDATRGTDRYPDMLFTLTSEYIDGNMSAEAGKCLSELRELKYPSGMPFPEALAGYLDARLSIINNDWSAAKATLIKVAPQLGRPEWSRYQCSAYLNLGQCYGQEFNQEQQMLAYSQAAKIDTYSVPARSGLAEIYLSKGNAKDALEQYVILTKAPHPEADAFLAAARTSIVIRLQQDPAKRDWEPVEKWLDDTERLFLIQPQNRRAVVPQVAMLRAEVWLAKEKPDEAYKVLVEAAKKFSKTPSLWSALISLSMHQADKATDPAVRERMWDRASKEIAQEEQILGDRGFVRQSKATLAARRKDPQLAALLKQLGEGVDKMNPFERSQLWRSLGDMSLHAGNLELTRHYYRLIAQQEPRNIPIRYMLCEFNLQAYEKDQAPDIKELDTLLNEIDKLGGHGPFWLYGKAVRTLVQSKKPDPQLLVEARGYLKDALEISKNWGAPFVLYGKVCELQNDAGQALECYKSAIYLGVRDNDVIRRTVHLMVQRGKFNDAKPLFDYLQKQKSPVLDEMQTENLYLNVFIGNIEEALKGVDNSVAVGSKHYEDFLLQGQLYEILVGRLESIAAKEKRDPKTDSKTIDVANRAVKSFMKARDLNPRNDQVWLATVQIFADLHQPDRVKPLIAEVEQSLKGKQPLITPIALGACYEMLKEPDKAQAMYESVLKAAPQDSRTLRQIADFYLRNKKAGLAEPLLKQIAALQSPAAFNDSCWARRQQAVILMGRGDFDDLCQGMALIDENLKGKGASLQDKQLRVNFLIADPRREKLGEAIAAMEELVKDPNATADDNFILAKLYLRKPDWGSYVKRMDSVLGAQKGAVAPAHLIFYINSLLQKNEMADADKWLQAMEKSAPNYLDTVLLRAEYKFRNGEYKAASDLAYDFLRNPKAEPLDRGIQLLGIAGLMEHFANQLRTEGKQPATVAALTEHTDELYTALRSKKISDVGELFYAAYLARQKRVPQFLEVLEQCSDKYPAEKLYDPSMVMLSSNAASPAQYLQLEKILVAASKKSKGSVLLLMALAKLHEQQRQYDKAIADYREVLSRDPRQFAAMNNLAVNLVRAGRDLDEALNLVNHALSIKGPLAEVLDSLAIVHIARQESDKALADATAAVRDVGTAEQYFHQAWAYLLAGKKAEASAAFQEATNRHLDVKGLDPNEISVYDRLKDGL